MRKRFTTPAVLLLGAFWLAGVALMIRSYVANPVDPSLRGAARYGTTYAGELRFILAVTASEILVSVAVLRPWSYRRSWGRSLALAAVLAPWMLLWGGFGMHAGPTTHAHTLWLFFYWVGLLAAAVTSGVSSARAGWASMIDAA